MCVHGVQTVLSLLATYVNELRSLCWVRWPCVFIGYSLCSKFVGHTCPWNGGNEISVLSLLTVCLHGMESLLQACWPHVSEKGVSVLSPYARLYSWNWVAVWWLPSYWRSWGWEIREQGRVQGAVLISATQRPWIVWVEQEEHAVTGKLAMVIEQGRRAEDDWSSYWQKCAPCKWGEEGSQWLWCPAAYKILPLARCLSALTVLATSLVNSQKCVKLSVLKSHLIAGTSLALTIQMSSLYRINGVVQSFIQRVKTYVLSSTGLGVTPDPRSLRVWIYSFNFSLSWKH